MAVYAGKNAVVKIAGTPIAMTDEATYTIGDKYYIISNVNKKFLDLNSPITVKVDGVPVTSGFYIKMFEGEVVFDTVAVRTVTVSGKYVPTSVAAEAKEWSLSVNNELIDVTKFSSGGFVEKIPGLKSAEGSMSQWWTIDSYFQDALISGKPVIIELYAKDTSLSPDRMWAVLNSTEMSAAVDGAVEEAVSFESTDKMLLGGAYLIE